MNLLPFIIAFLVLFAGINTALFQNVRNTLIEQNAYSNLMHSERAARNEYVRAKYHNIKPVKDNSKDKNPKDPNPVGALRFQARYRQNGRLNVYALLTADEPPQALINAFYELFDRYYQNLPEYKHVNPTHFFEQIKQAFAKSDAQSFKELKLSDPKEQALFHRMCRGTTYYSIEDHEGYPPLDDVFRIEKAGAQRPLRWRVASPATLQAFFGPELTANFLEYEKELNVQHKQINQKELLDFFGEQNSFSDFNDSVQTLLDHSCGKTRRTSLTEVSDNKHLTRTQKEYLKQGL